MGQGSIYRFTVPLFGPEVGYAVDPDTRAEQMRLFWDVLKPRSIEARVGAMAEEVQVYSSLHIRSLAVVYLLFTFN